MRRACYAAWSRDAALLLDSTSGGAFTEIAKTVLQSGGIVVGAAYGEGLAVEHRVAHTLSELAPLRGVKYVFSAIPKGVWDEMSAALAGGRNVMFVGTPCLAAAVRKRFGSSKGLLICDLVCFGAPSQSIWLKYVRWMEEHKGVRLVYICPRDKKRGWGRVTYYRYNWADGSEVRRNSTFDPYAQIFYRKLGFREACFKCPFRGFDRISDITLCDMWSADELGLSPKTLRGGVSGVIVHTTVGATAFANSDMERLEVDEKQMLRGNPCIVESEGKPEHWDQFARDAETLDFGSLVVKYKLQISRTRYCRQRLRALAGKVVRSLKFRILSLI